MARNHLEIAKRRHSNGMVISIELHNLYGYFTADSGAYFPSLSQTILALEGGDSVSHLVFLAAFRDGKGSHASSFLFRV